MTDIEPRPFPHRHLLAIADLSRQDIEQILELSDTMKSIAERPIKKLPTLRGRTVLNLFLENSTRTRVSFELAAKRMSADAINVSGSGSSLDKGETILDTAQNLMAMRPDVIVIRHSASGAPALIANHVDAAVVNAGDGAHEHPTQGLLDCATIREARGKGGKIDGVEVAIVGDIEHSRVARSTTLALIKLGARVRLCGPQTLLPRGIEHLSAEHGDHITVTHRVEQALEGADVIMMLRVQNERIGGSPRFPNTREYSRCFGLNKKRLALAKPDAIVMHPGPVNRGVEIMPDVQDGERSLILDQVTHGVAVRMAVLYLLGGGALGDKAA
jgi:aspartate carbamoyltransferase catalytic subunit